MGIDMEILGILELLKDQIGHYTDNALWVNKALTYFHTIQHYQPFNWENTWFLCNSLGFDDIITRFDAIGIVYNPDVPLEEQLDFYNETLKAGYQTSIDQAQDKVDNLNSARGYTGRIPQRPVLGKTGILSHVRPFPRAGEV